MIRQLVTKAAPTLRRALPAAAIFTRRSLAQGRSGLPRASAQARHASVLTSEKDRFIKDTLGDSSTAFLEAFAAARPKSIAAVSASSETRTAAHIQRDEIVQNLKGIIEQSKMSMRFGNKDDVVRLKALQEYLDNFITQSELYISIQALEVAREGLMLLPDSRIEDAIRNILSGEVSRRDLEDTSSHLHSCYNQGTIYIDTPEEARVLSEMIKVVSSLETTSEEATRFLSVASMLMKGWFRPEILYTPTES